MRDYILFGEDEVVVENDWAVIFCHLQKRTLALTFLSSFFFFSSFQLQLFKPNQIFILKNKIPTIKWEKQKNNEVANQ